MPYPPQDPNDAFAGFSSRRSVVHGTRGIVSTVSPLATQAGLRILREGGNAADAAIAAAAVLGLVDPAMTGMGGDAFALFYSAGPRTISGLNGSGRSASGATLANVLADLKLDGAGVGAETLQYATIPTESALSVTVPGAAAAWVDVVERFGSGRVGMGQVLAPAIELAEGGCGVGEVAAYWWAAREGELRAKANGAEVLWADPEAEGGCRAPRVGEVYRNEMLARTMRLLVEKGKKGFYEGPVAEAVVEVVKAEGGYLSLEDLKHHGEVGSEMTEALPFRLEGELYAYMAGNDGAGLDLWQHLPNGQGKVTQMALGLLQELQKNGTLPRFKPEDHNSTKYIHALIQVLRLAFADGMQHIADPSTTSLDYKTLLSPSYLASRAKLFDPARATSWPIHGHPALQAHDTVYLAVTDADGNACSFVNSVSETFGSLVVPRGVGFVLHSRGAGFNLQEGHPNAYAPRKRPYNTIMTALVTRPTHPTIEPKSNEPQAAQPQKPSHDQQDAGDLLMVLGVMGGAMQPQGHVQVLLNMALFGMDPQRALDAPRLCIGVSLPGKSTNPSKKVDEAVYLEDGVPDHVAGALRAMGYEVEVVRGMKRALFGRGQVIAVQEEKGGRMFAAGSDMRGDGAAAPLV